MTNTQQKTIERLKTNLLSALSIGNVNNHEIKQLDIEDIGCGIISFVGEVGMKNDEHTLAAIFCRERIHLFIGKHGGITYYDANSKTRRVGKYDSLLTVSYNQKYKD